TWATCSTGWVDTMVSAKAPEVARAKPAAMRNRDVFMVISFQSRITAARSGLDGPATKTLSSVAWSLFDAFAALHNSLGGAIRSMPVGNELPARYRCRRAIGGTSVVDFFLDLEQLFFRDFKNFERERAALGPFAAARADVLAGIEVLRCQHQ